MRTALLAGLFLVTALAGCSSKTLDCPDEYGPQFEDAYKTVADKLDEAGTPIPDADYDCISDPVEKQFGTDPNDASSYPTLQQLANSTIPGFGNGTAPPVLAYEWRAEEASGTLTTTQVVAPGASGSVASITIPGNALRTFVNFTLSSSVPGPFEVNIRLDAPDCGQPTGCADSVTQTTDGGITSFDLDAPASGAWTVSFFAATGAFDGDWTAEVNSLVPVKVTGSTATVTTTATTGA